MGKVAGLKVGKGGRVIGRKIGEGEGWEMRGWLRVGKKGEC